MNFYSIYMTLVYDVQEALPHQKVVGCMAKVHLDSAAHSQTPCESKPADQMTFTAFGSHALLALSVSLSWCTLYFYRSESSCILLVVLLALIFL
jgi:hypothetical protein